MRRRLREERVMKYFYVSVGCLSLACGIIGIVTPILPTTPFVLLSAFCFARGSNRFHMWLTMHHAFGPMIKKYHNIGVPPYVKAVAIACATISIGISAYIIDTPTLLLLLVCAWVLACVIVLRLPYRKEEK